MARPWDKRDDEKMFWYSRFERFRLMGPQRSLLGAYLSEEGEQGRVRKCKKAPTSWIKARDRYDWVTRAEAWDAEQQRVDREEWERRKSIQRQKEWEAAEKLAEKAQAMLTFPLAESHVDGPDGPIIIKPARWGMSDVARLLETASKLARLSAGMETDKTQVEVSADVRELSDEDLANIIRGRSGATEAS